MSTTANGYIIDVTDDEGVAIIPAPPSPQGMDSVDTKHLSSSYGAIGSTIASIGSSCPSRDSVSAAIALVRAKQVAKSAILRAQEQILQPRSVSSDQTSSSVATESSMKDKATNYNEMVESENSVPVTSVNRDKPISVSKAPSDSLFFIDSRRESIQEDLDFSVFSVKDVPSLHSIVQVPTSNTSLPQGPSFEQNSDEPSDIIHAPSDDIPGPPSLATNESDDLDFDFDGTVDANTIEDVNAFLSRLGVGALQSTSNESDNSIERLRMLSSGSSGASSDGMKSSGSSIREVQPKTLAEISAIIDDVAKKHGENAEAQLRTSQPSSIYESLGEPIEDHKDPPSTFALETESQKADPPGPSHLSEDINREENPFLPHSFSAESIEDCSPPPPSVAVQDEKTIDESNDKNMHDKESETCLLDESFAADVRKTLSTVEEAEDDDSTDEYDREDNNDKPKQGTGNVPQPSTLLAVASEEQESVYGVDGRKEPKGMYEKAKVEVEKIPLSNIGVEQAIDNNMSLMSTDSQQVGIERHTSVGRNEIHNKSKASETLETHDSASSVGSRGFSDAGSLPWALRDVASEETMRATGRRRPQFVVSGPRPSNKSRYVASLFDDTSQQASETASEFRSGLSFGSDDRSGDNGSSKNDESDDDTEVLTSDSVEANRCIVDTLLYNDYEPENDYNVQRGKSDDVNDEPTIMDNAGKDDSTDSSDGESSKVEMMSQDQSEEADDQNLKKDPSGEMIALKVGKGAISPTKISNFFATMDDQRTVEVGQKQHRQYLKKLMVPIIDGHTPSLVESAQIRETAQKANVSLEVVDQFLDYATDARPDVASLISKSWESFNLSKSWESHNEDDDDVEAFLVRVEAARVAAAKKSISDAAADVEAMLKAEEEATAMTAEEEGKKQSNSFLHQFEDLDLKDDCEADDGVQSDHASAPVENVVDVMSPTMLVKYFSNVGQRKFEGENEEKLVNDFKRLMMPVINGNKPSVIEEAQIRQAALKADVPLDFVDTFIEYVNDENPEVAPQVSKDDERDFLVKGWGAIEDLDEDDAIAAFLSSKIGAEELEKGEMCTNRDEESSKAKALQKKKARELTSAGSRDYEPSITSTVEPGFSLSKESEIEPDFNRSGDSEVEPDFNISGDSEVEPNFNRSDEETDCDVIGFKTSASNGLDESKKSGDEKCVDSIHIPKVVETSIMDKTDPVDVEMLKACKRIESYDEGSWQRRTAMATYGWGWKEATWLSPKTSPSPANLAAAGIRDVAASKDASNFIFNKKSFPLARKNCKLSYNRRVKPHTGYFDVDMYSLQESAAFGKENLYKDETPWELRHVRQRFLHERSLTFSRNWFGDLVKTNGNDKIKAPICKPKSMEMPMRKIPDPGDWTPEWYTTWGGRKLLLRRPSIDASFESSIGSGSDSYTEKDYYDNNDSLRSYSTGGSTYEDDEDWEDAPECGTFVNTKLKIGEHVTRVHPDYTSSLRKSRWRKKYFPIGTFPY